MAIQVGLPAAKSGVGVAIPTAYARIGQITIFEDGRVDFECKFYFSKVARNVENAAPIKTLRYTYPNFDFNSSAGIKTILYGYLKTLPDFSAVVDI